MNRFTLLTLVLVLAACSSPPAPEKPVAKAAPPARDLIAEVRAVTAHVDGFDVQPLSDAAAADLMAAARAAEQRGDFAEADRLIVAALRIAADDPEILQYRAEIALGRGALDDAETFAYRSYERGPQVGTLCRRNWAAIRVAREARGSQGAAEVARAQAQRCVVEPPVRM